MHHTGFNIKYATASRRSGRQEMANSDINLSGFTRVDIRGPFRFEIIKADSFAVTIDDGWRRTRAFVVGDLLVVDHPWYDVLGWFTPWKTPHVKVQMPDLLELKVSGANSGAMAGFQSAHDFRLQVRGASRLTGDITAENCQVDLVGASTTELTASVTNLKLKVTGASRLTGTVKANRGEVEVLGASRMRLSGSLEDAAIKVAGASHLDLDDFTLRNPSIKLYGASQCTVNVEGKMDVELAGASRLIYGGNPVIGNMRVVGASTVARK
jgi:hypothetical protein